MTAENLRLREALSLYKVSEAIAASLSLDQVLETVADSCLHEVRGDLVSTWLDDGEGGYFERQHLRGASMAADAVLGHLGRRRLAPRGASATPGLVGALTKRPLTVNNYQARASPVDLRAARRAAASLVSFWRHHVQHQKKILSARGARGLRRLRVDRRRAGDGTATATSKSCSCSAPNARAKARRAAAWTSRCSKRRRPSTSSTATRSARASTPTCSRPSTRSAGLHERGEPRQRQLEHRGSRLQRPRRGNEALRRHELLHGRRARSRFRSTLGALSGSRC